MPHPAGENAPIPGPSAFFRLVQAGLTTSPRTDRYLGNMRRVCWLVLLLCLTSTACAGTIAPRTVAAGPARDALLVLPGFGYGKTAKHTLESMAPALKAEGIDLYVPAYLERRGLDDSRTELGKFVREHHLERYERVHVFAFLAGGWAFNGLAEDTQLLPNLTTVIYDRSPYQERAPRVATEKLRPFAWLRYGAVIFDLAKTPYTALPRSDVKIGLMVETTPTSFIKRFKTTARSYGPYAFECDALAQPYDDCIFVPMDHSQMYSRFGDVWLEMRAFIRGGRFSEGAVRTPPDAGARRGDQR